MGARKEGRPALTGEPVDFGVDVARFGDCETVVCIRQGDAVPELHAWRGADLMQTAGRIQLLAREWGPVTIRVDAAGLGAGVADCGIRIAEFGLRIGVRVRGRGSSTPPRARRSLGALGTG